VRSLLPSILALWFAMSPAHAWHETGHKMTASIAWAQLTEVQQRYVSRILRAHPRFAEDFVAGMPIAISQGSDKERALWAFERASYWSDLVPNISDAVRTQYHRGTWHYINMPVYLTDEDEKVFAGNLSHNMSTIFSPPLRQNLNVIQALKGNLKVWRDETAADADKAVALCWILHLTGDLHQPLHNVALFSRTFFREGDRGGNSIAIERNGRVSNLHAIWDGSPRSNDDFTPDAKTKAMLANDYINFREIDKWLSEHQKLAMEYVYTDELRSKLFKQVSNQQNPQISLSREYLATAKQVAIPQVILAGHRIAKLLAN